MPTVSETPWGHWGNPSPTPAWTDAPPKLHGDTGGVLKPGYAHTLKWYYNRASNPKDKEHCHNLLKKFDSQNTVKQDKKFTALQRPQTAPRITNGRTSTAQASLQPKPPQKPEFQTKSVSIEVPDRKRAYQKQLASIQRLSRPKTVRYSTSRQPLPDRTIDSLRPKSAMADIGRRRAKDPYLTTHELEYPGYPTGLYAEATRPMSSKGFTVPYKISDPVGATTCEDEFSWKTAPRVEPIRSGTSSGNRKNNPHPHESFMIWRLPNKTAEGMMTAPAKHLGYRELTNDVMDQILKDQLKSTYQNDYLGIPQGFQVKEAIDAPADWRASVRRPLDTTVRHSYTKPEQQPELTGNTSRYGCNKNKGVAALGAVPTVTKDHVRNQELIKGKTSYESEFRNRYSQPDLLRLLNEQTNKKIVDSFLRYAKIQEDHRCTEKNA